MLDSIYTELFSHFASSGSISLLLNSSVLAVLIYFITTSLYSVYFSPLSIYPGPRIYAISKLPITYHHVNGTIIQQLGYLHAKYGPVVRVGPSELSYIDSAAWKDIYGFKTSTGGQMPKDPAFYDLNPRSEVYNVDSDPSDESHARQRKAFSHAFSDRALREQEGLVAKYVDKLVEKLGMLARGNEGVDLVKMLNFTTFDIMSDLAFGEPLDLLE
jgi:hypothetical protein